MKDILEHVSYTLGFEFTSTPEDEAFFAACKKRADFLNRIMEKEFTGEPFTPEEQAYLAARSRYYEEVVYDD